MIRFPLSGLVALICFAESACALDAVQSTTAVGRLPTTLCTLTPGGIATNRADGTLSFCSRTSAIKTQVLIDLAQSLASQLGNLDVSGLKVSPIESGAAGTLADLIVSRAALDSPAFTGTPSAQTMMVGRQAAANGITGGLCIGGAAADESGACSMLASDGLANWTRLQPSKNFNAQELNIYGTAAQGYASATAGGNTLKRVTSASGDPGSPFDPAWVGRLFYWGRAVYRVASVIDTNTLTVAMPAGAAVSFGTNVTDRYHYVRTTAAGFVSVSGKAVTRVSGDPFIPFITGTDFILRINGTAYEVASYTDKDHITLSTSAGTQTGVAFDYSFNINNQIAALRVQKTIGIDEENATLEALATGSYALRIGRASAGQYYPLYIQNGDSGGVPIILADFSPGIVAFGGPVGGEALRVSAACCIVNRMELAGGSTGHGPSFRSRGADANIPIYFDAQGSGGVYFTDNGFGQTLFQIVGATQTGASWASILPGAVPTIQPEGSDGNAPMALLGRGSSGVRTGAFVRTAEPTTTDVPIDQCVDWNNTTAGTYKHVCNFGGTLRSVTLQ